VIPILGPVNATQQIGGYAPETEALSHMSGATKSYFAQWATLEVKGGLLYRRWQSKPFAHEFCQLLLLIEYRQEVLQQANLGFTGGHLGIRKTLEQIQRQFYWIGWQCDACAQYYRGTAVRQGNLQCQLCGKPWERVGVDITGPHPRQRNDGY
jgi:hypothetical protein